MRKLDIDWKEKRGLVYMLLSFIAFPMALVFLLDKWCGGCDEAGHAWSGAVILGGFIFFGLFVLDEKIFK